VRDISILLAGKEVKKTADDQCLCESFRITEVVISTTISRHVFYSQIRLSLSPIDYSTVVDGKYGFCGCIGSRDQRAHECAAHQLKHACL
jgi:hypothetical protein